MHTDGPLKVLFRKHALDLLPLTGDRGATLRAAEVLELHSLRRSVDCVLELERDGESYYRHLEFQAGPDPGMPARCFEYNSQLVLQYGLPALTTVVYLFPPAPKEPPVFRVVLGGREVNRWVFDTVYLWELDAETALASGAPGLLALVPLMRGGADLGRIGRAAREIERKLSSDRMPDAEAVLLLLAGRYYTVSELSLIVGRERMIQSSVYQEALAEGEAKGRVEGEAKGRVDGEAKGRVEAERELCVEMAREYHPGLLERAVPAIQACSDAALLKRWVLQAPRTSDEEFARLLGVAAR